MRRATDVRTWDNRSAASQTSISTSGHSELEPFANLAYVHLVIDGFRETGGEAQAGVVRWIDYYNRRHPHSSLGDRTPDETDAIEPMTEKLAAQTQTDPP